MKISSKNLQNCSDLRPLPVCFLLARQYYKKNVNKSVMRNHLFLSLLVKDVQVGDIVPQLLGKAVSRNL